MTKQELLETLAKSELVDSDALKRRLLLAPTDVHESGEKLADWMVEEQILTEFQANKLLKGIWRGLVIDDHEIQSFLGRGGMGNVYLTYDRRRRRHCAMKLLIRTDQSDKRHVLRFLREIEVSRRLQHTSIAQSYGSGNWEGVYYLTLEYVPGITLFRLVRRGGGPPPLYWAVSWMSEIASALDYAHQTGIIHRDLKPSNVILTPDGHAKLLDLGLARWYDDDHNEDRVVGHRRVVGSFDYIAPEQGANSARADARSDIYALGCVLYFALVGRAPFHHITSVREKIRHHQEVPPPSLVSLRPELPVALASIVSRMLSKEPQDRYQVAGQVRDVLARWAVHLSSKRTPELPSALTALVAARGGTV